MSEIDPYLPPKSELSEEIAAGPLAGRFSRLGAVMIDGTIVGVLNVLVSQSLGLGMLAVPGPFHATLLGALIEAVIFLLINGYWLAKSGQSLGKKLLGIAIVRNEDETLLSLLKLYITRMLPLAVVSVIPMPLLPVLVLLADSLSIFRGDRRCIHDLIAGTKVIKVRG